MIYGQNYRKSVENVSCTQSRLADNLEFSTWLMSTASKK